MFWLKRILVYFRIVITSSIVFSLSKCYWIYGINLLKYISCLTLYFHSFTEEKPTYPETVTISSTGGASERKPSVMGVYKITNITHSGRPVWQSTVREDRYLFYNGNSNIYLTCLCLSEHIIFPRDLNHSFGP